jgi:cell division protease FtsH
MGLPSKRIASYLSALNPGKYDVTGSVANSVNYLLDSWWAKIDERNSRVPNAIPIPFDLQAHVRETFLGCEIHKCVGLNHTYPGWAKALNSWAFLCLFEGVTSSYEVVPFLDTYQWKEQIKGSYDFSMQTAMLPVGLDKTEKLPIFGTFFVQKAGTTGLDGRLVVKLDLGYEGMSNSVHVQAADGNDELAIEFLRALNTSRVANDIYYRRCLTYSEGVLDFTRITDTKWESIILKEDIKQAIRENSLGVLNNLEVLQSLGMCPNRNVMLISPPGMAKTTTFRAISNEVAGSMTTIWCTGKSIMYPEHVTNLFDAARGLAPCIVFIEDMDLFGKDRLMTSDSRVLNEFLACLDGSQENTGVVVMASTNDIQSMDEALVNRPGRFDTKIEIPYPDAADRSQMFAKFFGDYHASPDQSVTKTVTDSIIKLTEGLTGDYVKSLVKTVIIRSAARNPESRTGVIEYSAADLMAAAEQVMKGYQIGKRSTKHHTYTSDNTKAEAV